MIGQHYFDAVRSNNEGVASLEAGDLAAAKVAFKLALSCMTRAIAESDEEKPETSSSEVNFQWSDNAKQPLHQTNALDTTFVYRRALRILPAINHASNERGMADESSVIVYNMAVSFHLSGLENDSDSMERALRFYEISYAIRQKRDGQSKLGILEMAILNNMGQVYHELVEYDSARQCFDQLSTRLMFLNQTGFISILAQQDCDGFVLNVMLDAPSSAAAA